MSKPLHIAHILYRFDIGGLENGVVNLINQLPENEYRHSIICIDGYCAEFYARVQTSNTEIFSLAKRSGQDLGMHWRAFNLLRKLNPDLTHSRNLAALECQLAATLAGVRYRIHGEHGWDSADFLKQSRYIKLKRLLRPLVKEYVALSCEGREYLRDQVGVSDRRISLICNGVDTRKFSPGINGYKQLPEAWDCSTDIIFGCVGRMADVKNHSLLADAFIALNRARSEQQKQARLVIIGDGKNHAEIRQRLISAGLENHIWLPGARDDVDELLPSFSLFVLPSLAEGISNTILEAMACGLPVIATDVGGNPELVSDGETGALVASNSTALLTEAMMQYVKQPELITTHGSAARQRAVANFSIESMVSKYANLYQRVN